MTPIKCIECDAGALHPGVVSITRSTAIGAYTLQVPGLVCDHCGASQVSQPIVEDVIEPWEIQLEEEERRLSA